MTDLPSYELVQRFMHETGFPIADPDNEMVFPEAKFMKLASRLIQHGADQELEACVEWFDNQSLVYHRDLEHTFRTARRPKTPSLKDQALQVLASAPGPDYPRVMTVLNADEHALIRQALEALPND